MSGEILFKGSGINRECQHVCKRIHCYKEFANLMLYAYAEVGCKCREHNRDFDRNTLQADQAAIAVLQQQSSPTLQQASDCFIHTAIYTPRPLTSTGTGSIINA